LNNPINMISFQKPQLRPHTRVKELGDDSGPMDIFDHCKVTQGQETVVHRHHPRQSLTRCRSVHLPLGNSQWASPADADFSMAGQTLDRIAECTFPSLHYPISSTPL
jgi:hypothetical protein